MTLKYKKVNMIEVYTFDQLVEEIYERPYSFQQQEGCKSRGTADFTVPSEETYDYENDTIPEIVNGEEMGVSFKAWLERDPKQLLSDDDSDFSRELWWNRNFYPDTQIILNDLHAKGLVEAGDYVINIDW